MNEASNRYDRTFFSPDGISFGNARDNLRGGKPVIREPETPAKEALHLPVPSPFTVPAVRGCENPDALLPQETVETAIQSLQTKKRGDY